MHVNENLRGFMGFACTCSMHCSGAGPCCRRGEMRAGLASAPERSDRGSAADPLPLCAPYILIRAPLWTTQTGMRVLHVRLSPNQDCTQQNAKDSWGAALLAQSTKLVVAVPCDARQPVIRGIIQTMACPAICRRRVWGRLGGCKYVRGGRAGAASMHCAAVTCQLV